MMKIAIGSDHAGFSAKNEIAAYLKAKGHEVTDFGTFSAQSCDYPDFGCKVAKAVAGGDYERGVVICSTGVGISIAANKVKGIRCALCTDEFTAEMTRRHNDSNVLAMGANVTPIEKMKKIADIYFSTDFEGGRHARRVGKITMIENGEL
ncbi:MAG: ribose 5-phosphate isomerase B [Clostridia bacterium]|nr:ribose 5-phosphate isomerase B [Clostridia bacterium]